MKDKLFDIAFICIIVSYIISISFCIHFLYILDIPKAICSCMIMILLTGCIYILELFLP